MISNPPYFIPWALFFIALGVTWYLLDRRFGVAVYRWWYKMTHEHPLPAGEGKGFIHERKAKARLAAAIVVALAQSALVIAITREGLLMEFLSFFLEVPATMLGFYVGPWLRKIWRKKDKVLDKVDAFESGETTVVKELKDASRATSEKVKDLLGVDEDDSSETEPTLPVGAGRDEAAPEPAPEPEPEPEPDPRDYMNKYLRKDDDGKS